MIWRLTGRASCATAASRHAGVASPRIASASQTFRGSGSARVRFLPQDFAGYSQPPRSSYLGVLGPLALAAAALCKARAATRADGSGSVSRRAGVQASSQRMHIDTRRRQVFVVGNEAADADSLVSAYVTACLVDTDAVQGIPLAQITRNEFKFRGDALALFKRAGAELSSDGSPTKMVFADEVDWEALNSLSNRSVILTDHNKMKASLAGHFEGRVERILDHHAVSGAHPEAQTLIVDGLGSTCTLVAEQMLAEGKAQLEFAVLLAGVILIDTRNFNPKEKKGTPRDKDALDRLAALLPKMNQTVWYEQLMEARYDVSHLTVKEHLLLDTKVVQLGGLDVAFCSLFGEMHEVISKARGPAGFEQECRELAKSKGWNALVCLFKKDASNRKGLVLVPLNESSADGAVCRDLEARLKNVPGNLPHELLTHPLVVTQGLHETGFQLEPAIDLQPLAAFFMKGTVTRKTLLPLSSF